MAHPDCCGGDDDRDPLGCPLCGRRGHGVSGATAEAFIPPEHRKGAGAFWFCDTPDCTVAYYPPGCGAPVFVGEVPVGVGTKTPFAEDNLLCHCFGISRREALRRAASDRPASAEVTARMRAEGCACEVKNPSGRCCLEDVRAVEADQAGQTSGTPQ